jgi:hypothetical protein
MMNACNQLTSVLQLQIYLDDEGESNLLTTIYGFIKSTQILFPNWELTLAFILFCFNFIRVPVRLHQPRAPSMR